MKLRDLSQQSLQPIVNGEISLYTGELTTKVIIESVAKIKKAFPTLPIGFYDVFTDRLKANGFNDARLRDAVAYVIDNCIYPTPTIAQFISFDKRIKTYTYSEYCDLCNKGDGKNYEPMTLPGNSKPVWVHVNDINSIK